MGNCKLRFFCEDGHSIITYTCDEMRKIKDDLLEKKRKDNQTDRVEKSGWKDKDYHNYKNELEEFLKKCECNQSYRKDRKKGLSKESPGWFGKRK
jgi:hypothetical protein